MLPYTGIFVADEYNVAVFYPCDDFLEDRYPFMALDERITLCPDLIIKGLHTL